MSLVNRYLVKNIFDRLRMLVYRLILLTTQVGWELASSATHLAVNASNAVSTRQCCCGNILPNMDEKGELGTVLNTVHSYESCSVVHEAKMVQLLHMLLP